jgi:hypothetical protein
MPEDVVEKQPDRAAVEIFQEAEAVGGSEVNSFNRKVNGKVNTLLSHVLAQRALING